MKQINKQMLVPKLRFPEFRDAEGWTERNLSDVLAEHGSKSTGVEQVFSVSVHKGIINQIEHLGRSFSASSTDHYSRVLRGDVVYTKSPTGDFPFGIIKQSKLEYPVIVSPLYGVFSPETIAMGTILDAYFESPANAKIYLEPLVQKGAKNTINIKNDRFLSGALPLPLDKAEQQKIADCLTSVDDLIAAHRRKLAALKDHKKGLMQQLFPREGETQPRLRFPAFRDAGEWGERELGPKTSKVGSGITPRGGYKNYKRAGRPFMRSQNIGWGCLLLDDIAFIDEETHSTFASTEIELFDVLLNITGASIGRSAVADNRIVGGNVNQHVCIIRVLEKELNPFFLSQYLISKEGQRQIDSFQAGGNRQGLNFGQIRSFSISLPPLFAEQKRIADCLSALDDQISAQSDKISTLQQHKKGLMQQLFPSPEEAI